MSHSSHHIAAAGGGFIDWFNTLFTDLGSMGIALGRVAIIATLVITVVRAGSKVAALLLGGAIAVLAWWFLNNFDDASITNKINSDVRGLGSGSDNITGAPAITVGERTVTIQGL